MLQKLRGKKGTKGFTLIELMIVVAIIGILAAIAIPNFLNYQKKSKTTEAKTNIGGIKTSQISYEGENDTFVTCALAPAGALATTKTPWTASAGFLTIGWEPAGPVYYKYETDTAIDGATKSQMCVGAIADIDGDKTNGEWGYSTDTVTVPTSTSMASTGCDQPGQVQDLVPGSF